MTHSNPGSERTLAWFSAASWHLPDRWSIWLPLLLLLGASVLVVGLNLDLALARRFWSSSAGWRFADTGWVQWVYRWSNGPALITGGAGLLVALVSSRIVGLRRYRLMGWFLALTLLLGPGLVVNSIFKAHYGRPRPKQVHPFGGRYAFRPLSSPTFDSTTRSFPSGHASMGFYWLALTVWFWRRRRALAWGFLLLAAVHGGITGFVRMAQGGHWFSDVLWSAGLVYFSALAVYAVLPVSAEIRFRAPTRSRDDRASTVSGRDRPVSISVVVPFHNEAANVAHVLTELRSVLPAAEIIAVDDGSRDETWANIQAVPGVLGMRLDRNLGQSAAIYYGLQAATGELCGVMDGDGQNDPTGFLRLLQEWVRGDADVICGYRERRADAWNRRVASRVANRIRRWFLDDAVTDTGCSLKLFPGDAVQHLVPFRGLHRYLPAIFKQAGLSIAEVPVPHRERRAGRSKYGNWSRAVAGVRDLIGVSWLLNRKLPAQAPLSKP
ncbi:MAG: glycosyltransferase [Verrucomicrobia bacterium]|nr:glycosyltransferase [Verrucomicrobiota bacterium]